MKHIINENSIRVIVSETIKALLSEDEEHPEWEETVDDIMDKYKKYDEEFDDTTAGKDYKIDKKHPFFYSKDGNTIDADAIGNFHNDFAIVKKGNQFNFINSDGIVISDDWFDACNDFENGFAMVSKDKKRNFVNSEGQYLLETWADRAGDFMGETAPIIINGERHEVDINGNIL